MKFTTTNAAILKTLKLAKLKINRSKNMATKNSNQIINSVLITAQFDQVIFQTTDLEIETYGKIHATYIEKGQCIVNFLKLEKAIKSFNKKAIVTIEGDEKTVVLNCNGMRLEVETICKPVDYPLIERGNINQVYTAKVSELLPALEKTAYSMAKSDIRYYLNGMLFEFTADGLRLVSTDGHRMSWQDIPELTGDESHIISGLTIKTLIKLLKAQKDGFITIEFDDRHVIFKGYDSTLTAKMVDGQYPNYKSVIPEYKGETVIINRDNFLNACKSAKEMSNEKYHGVKFTFDKDTVKINSNSPEGASFNTELSCENNAGEIIAGFNVTYLIDALKQDKSENVEINIKDQHSSAIVSGNNLIMPMRL